MNDEATMTGAEPVKDVQRDEYDPWWARVLGLTIDWQSKPGDRERTYHNRDRGVELVVGRRGNRWACQVWSHEETLLNLACPWISVFWKIGPAKDLPIDMADIAWGTYISEGDWVFDWGKRHFRITLNPFHWSGYTTVRMRLDGEWDATPHYSDEGREVDWYEETHPYAIVSVPQYYPQAADPEVVIEQWHATATCQLSRSTRTRKWLPWWKKVEFWVEFSLAEEVGRGTGSWKGGTIGFAHAMLHGDRVSDVVNRACAAGRGL